jgi:hypothetical protein
MTGPTGSCRVPLAAGAGAGVAWLTLVLAVSLGSRETVLAPGQAIRFCGFYLDCHLSATVQATRVELLPGGGVRYTVCCTRA